MRNYSLAGITLLLLFQCIFINAQDLRYFGPEKILVKLDALTDVAEKELPYDRCFFLRKYLPKGSVKPEIAAFYEVLDKKQYSATPPSTISSANPQVFKPIYTELYIVKSDTDGYDAYDLFVSPLEPNKTYDLHLIFPMSRDRLEKYTDAFIKWHTNDVTGAKSIISDINAEKIAVNDPIQISEVMFEEYYKQHIKPILEGKTLNPELRNTVVAALIDQQTIKVYSLDTYIFQDDKLLLGAGTTKAFKLETRMSSYVQPEVGLVFYGIGGSPGIGVSDKFNGITPYLGVNLLLRPYDGNISFRPYVSSRVKWWQRVSFHLGLTLSSLAKDNQRSNLFKQYNPMLGVGYRLSSSIKLQGGVILYNKLNENPLENSPVVRPIGYAGISFDFRITNILGDLGKLLFSN